MKDVIEAFHKAGNKMRGDIFPDDRLMPQTALADANTAACGWVGEHWEKGGDLMIGINPGGGGDNYQRNATDDRLYGLLRAFRDSEEIERVKTFSALSSGWIEIQKRHNIWRLISALLDATGSSPDKAAFVNVLPFRTRNDSPAPTAILRKSADTILKPQIAALAPKRVFALGLKAHKILERLGDLNGAELVALPRTIGDSYIASQTAVILKSIQQNREGAI